MFLLCSFLTFVLLSTAELIVNVEHGQVLGRQDKDYLGTPFYSFMGIPYAAAPVGPLRFKDPQPREPWQGLLNGTREAKCCYSPQLSLGRKVPKMVPRGDEDCLIVNVFTHKLDGDLKDVMVFIHGGGFISGSSERMIYGPEYLMTEDIVLVTLQYRLGVLGFLSLKDQALGVPGNAGLKDQVEALKWIQRNIKEFGGNPKSVTVFGESAGSASVSYLMLSPLAKGLFHKAILQSGTAVNPWAVGENNVEKLLTALNSSETDETKILEFLQKITSKEIALAQIELGDWLSASFIRNFGPSLERDSSKAFISKDPAELFSSGDYLKIPAIIGFNSHEGMLLDGTNKINVEEIVNQTYVVPFNSFKLDTNSKEFEELNNKIIQFYFKDGFNPEDKEAVYSVYTDAVLSRGIQLTAKAIARTSSHPVYFYKMTVESKLNLFKKLVGINHTGVAHGDDLGYLFKTVISRIDVGSFEETASRRFIKMWTNFAKTGNPTPEGDEFLNVQWKPVKEGEFNFLEIGEELVPGTNPDRERMAFWDEISKSLPEFYQ